MRPDTLVSRFMSSATVVASQIRFSAYAGTALQEGNESKCGTCSKEAGRDSIYPYRPS
jgi:hypothetical protein